MFDLNRWTESDDSMGDPSIVPIQMKHVQCVILTGNPYKI